MNIKLINNAVKNMLSDKLQTILDNYFETSKDYLKLVNDNSKVEFKETYYFNNRYFEVTYGFNEYNCRFQVDTMEQFGYKGTDFIELEIDLPNPNLLYLIVNDRDIEDISLYQKIYTKTGYFEVWLQQDNNKYLDLEDLVGSDYWNDNNEIHYENTLILSSLEYTIHKLKS